ncbi:FecR family protein [Chitinophaga qingshengii]|uniref:FecR domain-containing protein n=1 Tax=Chitinophaga qingshengii TaxID=1569794 RepID=A0ABR7TH69_9BACT|nr:FecR domain-containing protein [Chitinophaga qingshengii]MBC9929851.1 FecR domain-containing protein [Chitinophaga qingshengii]
MEQETLQLLWEKISNGTATDQETALYLRHCQAAEEAGERTLPVPDTKGVEQRMLAAIHQRTGRRKTRRIPRYWYAAAMLTGLIALAIYLRPGRSAEKAPPAAVAQQDMPAGTDKAVLTLANGKKITLGTAQDEAVARQAGLRVYRSDSGEIVYEATGSGSGFHEITTPRGGQYRLVLQDGSKVWLNAASSLRYPATFTGSTRTVELKGEAYFEIAANARQPFIVHTAVQEVEVLGTHFNVNAYDDNAQVQTTLLQGRVSVHAGNNKMILQPGEQASLSHQSGALSKATVDANTAVAWKNGYFIFNDTYLTAVLQQLSRWYDVTVDLKTIPKVRYNGVIPRNVPLSKALGMLEFTGDVKFNVNNNMISIRH